MTQTISARMQELRSRIGKKYSFECQGRTYFGEVKGVSVTGAITKVKLEEGIKAFPTEWITNWRQQSR